MCGERGTFRCHRAPRAGNETKVTRRDEIETASHETRRDTRRSRSIHLETKSDETRRYSRPVHKNFLAKLKNVIFCVFEGTFLGRDKKYFSRPSRETKSRDETRSRRSRLVSSRNFSRRDRLVTGPTCTPLFGCGDGHVKAMNSGIFLFLLLLLWCCGHIAILWFPFLIVLIQTFH